jgi:hypothetical protein
MPIHAPRWRKRVSETLTRSMTPSMGLVLGMDPMEVG